MRRRCGGFEIDGNLVDDPGPGIDWATVLSAPSGQDNNPENTVFSASSKEDDDPNTWTPSGSPPGKADFANYYTYDQVVGGHAFFFFGWERPSPSGSDGYYLELNRLPNHINVGGVSVPTRSIGDLRFKIDETGNESLTLSNISNWNGAGWVTLQAGTGFDYAVNTSAVVRLDGTLAPKDTFVEVSLDLTDLIGLVPSCPGAFGTGNFRSFTGASDKNLEDYVKGFDVDAGSTCVGISTQATGPVVVGNSIKDVATLDPLTARGTVTFKAYGPGDATCDGTEAFTSADRPVTAGKATSEDFTPTQAGTYRWIASFTSSDPTLWANTTSKCNDANETSVVEKKQPTISTQASTGGTLPDTSLSDVATVSGLTATAGGTVTFNAYGPDDATCTGAPVSTSTKNLGLVSGGTATATSDVFTPSAAGTYRWVASYSGDVNNKPVAGACGDSNESAQIDKRQPTISTDASDGGALPSVALSDVATVGNLTPNAGGAVTFSLYGPDNASCAGTPIFSSTNNIGAVSGGGVATATSGTYTATAAGTYRWVASYGGDAKNKSVAGQCGDANESVVVDKAKPTITTDAQDTAKLPDATVSDTATLSGLNPGAGGTVVFRLYGPSSSPVCNDNDPNKNLVFTSGAVTVNGNGTYGPVSTQVTKAGTYYWIASYSGDVNNESVTGTCGEATEVSSVDKSSPGITTTATASTTLPGGTIKDTANVTGLTSDATGNVVFNLYGPRPSRTAPASRSSPAPRRSAP